MYYFATPPPCDSCTDWHTDPKTPKIRKNFPKTRILGACDSWQSGTEKVAQQSACAKLYLATESH